MKNQPFYDATTDVIRNSKVNTRTWFHERTHQELRYKFKWLFDFMTRYWIHQYYIQCFFLVLMIIDWQNKSLFLSAIGALAVPTLIINLIDETCAFINQEIWYQKYKRNPIKYGETILIDKRNGTEHYATNDAAIILKSEYPNRYEEKEIIKYG